MRRSASGDQGPLMRRHRQRPVASATQDRQHADAALLLAESGEFPRLSYTTEGPMWGHPMPVLGALGPFLEPFCGHLSPKLDKVS